MTRLFVLLFYFIEMATKRIFEVNLDKHVQDKFLAQRFKNAFQGDLFRSTRCGSCREAPFFAANLQTLVNVTQHFLNFYMQKFAPQFSKQKF